MLLFPSLIDRYRMFMFSKRLVSEEILPLVSHFLLLIVSPRLVFALIRCQVSLQFFKIIEHFFLLLSDHLVHLKPEILKVFFCKKGRSQHFFRDTHNFPNHPSAPLGPLAPAFKPQIFSRHALIKGEGCVGSQSFFTDHENELKHVNRVSLVKPTSSGKLCFKNL